MPFWKCAVLALLVPRLACAEDFDEPEQIVNELPPDDADEVMGDSISPEQLRKIHSKMDADGNGKVSLDEVLQFSDKIRKIVAIKDIETVLEVMDSDKDGKMSMDEFMKDTEQWSQDAEDQNEALAQKTAEEKKFKIADADFDGVLSKAEIPALFYPETHEGVLQIAAQHALDRKDTDKDGLLTFKEFWKGEGEAPGASDEAVADFKKLDKDASGKLDLEELKPWESGRFHTMVSLQKFVETHDRDNDLHLTSEEIAAAHSMKPGSDAHYYLREMAEHHDEL